MELAKRETALLWRLWRLGLGLAAHTPKYGKCWENGGYAYGSKGYASLTHR